MRVGSWGASWLNADCNKNILFRVLQATDDIQVIFVKRATIA